MGDRICSIEGCQKKARSRGWCPMHYERWRLHGDPMLGAQKERQTCAADECREPASAHGLCKYHYLKARRAGQVHGTKCSVDGCEAVVAGRGLCSKHWKRLRKHGDTSVNLQGPGSYDSAHHKVKARRGRASEYECAHCGGLAEQWAYDHQCPDEQVDRKTGFPFSFDIERYLPLCLPCHWKFDRGR